MNIWASLSGAPPPRVQRLTNKKKKKKLGAVGRIEDVTAHSLVSQLRSEQPYLTSLSLVILSVFWEKNQSY